jgi:hypothetical protein
MTEQKLNRSEITGLLVDLRGLGPTRRMRTVGRAVKRGALDPGMDDPRILSRREVEPRAEPAREEVLPLPGADFGKPVFHRGPRLLGNFELDRPPCLLLDDGGAVSNPAAGANIVDLQPHEVAASELAIDGEIEQSEVARSVLQLKPHPDRPNVLRFQRTLLPGQMALVPGNLLDDRLHRADRALPAPADQRARQIYRNDGSCHPS